MQKKVTIQIISGLLNSKIVVGITSLSLMLELF